MTTAIGNAYQAREPIGQIGTVGLRNLPHVELHYYARTPKPNAFKTVWLPMNASNRVVKDRQQDVLYLYYSRHLQDSNNNQPKSLPETAQALRQQQSMRPATTPDSIKAAMWMTNVNSLAPFASLGKPTCGFFFSRDTDNKKRRTGIPPTNTVKWRSHNVT